MRKSRGAEYPGFPIEQIHARKISESEVGTMDKLEMLMQDRGMTLFDCIMAEIMDERNAENARESP